MLILITACFGRRRYFYKRKNAKIAARTAIFKGEAAKGRYIPPPRQEANKSDLCGSVRHSRLKESANAYFSQNS